MIIERDSRSSDKIICTAYGVILLVSDLENGEESIDGSDNSSEKGKREDSKFAGNYTMKFRALRAAPQRKNRKEKEKQKGMINEAFFKLQVTPNPPNSHHVTPNLLQLQWQLLLERKSLGLGGQSHLFV
ncbi:uncharacterized protein LOC120089458 [Benincasa hispida]|uniref:uncharacterized protein LOC120089458 n=1 Tax=Benincasa hispida TaxID=102211 RepID=UPI0018FFC8B7|nr:uncharacterized protein LOC120089458 [Benincasa hispida]